MKLLFNFSMILLAFFSFSDESFSLTNYEIKRLCAKGKRVTSCIKNLKEGRIKGDIRATLKRLIYS